MAYQIENEFGRLLDDIGRFDQETSDAYQKLRAAIGENPIDKDSEILDAEEGSRRRHIYYKDQHGTRMAVAASYRVLEKYQYPDRNGFEGIVRILRAAFGSV